MRRVRSVLVAAASLVAATASLPAVAQAGTVTRAVPAAARCGRSPVATQAETALLARTIGAAAARQVCFQVDAASGGAGTFTITGSPGRIHIRASSLSAASEGAGWYLKYVVHADVGLGDFTPQVPRVLPAPGRTITQTSSAVNRYEGNDTQDGYTNPYQSWPEWQNMLDMYALHGINEVYVLPGTDAVYEQVLEDFGYTAAQARAWIPLPATQPWWVMQNLSSDTAPISQALLDQRATLGRKIVQLCKQLGITPVIPGYFGTVPTDFATVNATADNGNPPDVVGQGSWNGLARPAWLDPTDPLFAAVAADYYQQADRLLGSSSMYRMNPLQEGGNLGGIDAGAAASAIMTALQTSEPAATWMQLGWGANPTSAELNGLTAAQLPYLLIADGTSDTGSALPDRDTDWPDTNWLFGTIPFGGGQTAMGANGQAWLDRYYTELGAAGSHMTGISFEPEGINDPAAFELFAELPWHSASFSLSDWMTQYALGRYGTNAAAAAWSAIATAYARPVTCCDKESPLGMIPSLDDSTGSNFDTAAFATALPLLASAGKHVTQTAAFDYDLADVANQVITDWANADLPEISAAYQAKDLATFNGLTATWLGVMGLDNNVLATVPAFMLGRYVADAMQAGHSPAESAALRSNLLHLWTVWVSDSGPSAGNGDLEDYAAHLTSGMISGFYQPSWQMYFDSLSTALASSTAPASIDWLAYGNQFASATTPYPSKPAGSTVASADQIVRLLGISPVAAPKITEPSTDSASSPASIAGTGVAGAQVTVTDSGAAVCTATVAPDGTWSCAPPAPLADGTHTLSAVQSDSAGTSSAASVTFAECTSVPAGDPADAGQWDFTAGCAIDVSGHGNNGSDGSGVSFTSAGAALNGSASGQIDIGYSASYQPEAIGAGQSWHLDLTGVVPAAITGDYQTVAQSRGPADSGWIVYITPGGDIEFWMLHSGDVYVQALSGVTVVPGDSYNIEASWDGTNVSIAVSGAGQGSDSVALGGTYVPAGQVPLRIGAGSNTGTQWFFGGTIQGAAITIS